jgi:hypothetical protein
LNAKYNKSKILEENLNIRQKLSAKDFVRNICDYINIYKLKLLDLFALVKDDFIKCATFVFNLNPVE